MAENKTKFGYGLKENVASAIEQKKLDFYDIVFTSNVGKEQVGFIKPDGTVVYMKADPLNDSFDSYELAEAFKATSEAYGGQTIKAKLEDGKYHTYVLQPSDSGFTLEEVGAVKTEDLKQYVIVGTRPESNQQQGTIYIDDNIGYIWNGTEWKKIFEDVTAVLAEKAPLANPSFTGSVKIEGNEVATQVWVNTLIAQLNNGIPGLVDGTDNPLPTSGYKAGQSWRVTVAGTYAGQDCEPGDLIICLKDYVAESAGNTDFMVVQANIDGAVTGPDASTDGHVVVFNGTTGKIIKDSNVTIASLNDAIAKAHEHTNKTQLDSFTKTQTELLSDVASQITELEESITSTIDSKIEAAKEEILGDAASIDDVIDSKIGDLGESETVVSYITNAISSVGTDVTQQIEEALAEAKAYTDSSLTITEF